MRRLILCLDGTWNSSYAGKRTSPDPDGHRILKPSNTLKLARAVLPRTTDGVDQITYYDTGVGSLAKYPGKATRVLSLADKVLGGAWGAGFEGNVEDALHFLALNYQPGDEVYVFGFSRGAATARAVTTYLDCSGGLPVKKDAYYLPILFRHYVESHGSRDVYNIELEKIRQRKAQQGRKIDIVPVPIKYLGVWDTVLSLGSRILAFGKSTTHDKRVFHVGSAPQCVDSARHALAVDERRLDFRPEIWSGHDPARYRQRWFPGVHSNVGGGYDHDGLANLAFQWVLRGAKDLQVDPQFIAYYGGVVDSSLYQSASLGFRVFDAIRRRTGTRSLVEHPIVELDPSVIERMVVPADRIASEADRKEDKKAIRTAYRPENVIEFLAAQADLTSYLKSLGINEPLPPDVMTRIEQLRARGTRFRTAAA